jgi:predicted transcriptional regulator
MRMMMYRYKGLLERYIDILEALMKKHLTIDDVARKTNMSPSFVRRRVEFLIRNGLVEERTSSKEILYALTEKGKAVLRYLNFKHLEKWKTL